MSFKLLAIRPLEGTDPSLLKGLKPNCIYRFYNEYSYLNEQGEDVNDKQFEEFIKENGQNIFKGYSHQAVTQIKYKQEVPDGFFGKNINVSAVVGENGSGKSSLLELFYFVISFLENKNHYSHFSIRLDNIVVEIFFLDNLEVVKLLVDNRKVSKEKSKNYDNKSFYEKYIFNKGCFVHNNEDIYSANSLLKKYYCHILNYSLYGLNSNENEWLNRVFDVGRDTKNITINPNRIWGIIDVNLEELLAYKRLLFYVYGFNEKRLLDNVQVENHKIIIDSIKICKFSDEEQVKLGTTETKTIKSLCDILMYQNKFTGKVLNTDYLSYSKEDGFEGDMILFISNFINIISGNKLGKGDVVDNVVSNITKLIKNNNFWFLDDWSYLIHSLNLVFSFKEFVVLLFSYEPLRKYSFLLSIDKPQFQNSVQNILKKDVRMVQLKEEEEIGLAIKRILLHNIHKLRPTKEYFILKNLIDYYYKEIVNKLNDKEIFELNIFEIEGDKEYISEAKLIEELLRYYDGKFLKDCFQKCLEDINKDTTINTFELKQAISYFYSNILDDVKILESKHSDGIINVSLNEKYFTNIDNIEDIPIALFTYKINVSKEYIINEKKTANVFEFNKLSSGELQNINSILLVIYDVYQHVASLKNTDKEEIGINLIYDEIEMHLHPNYQRKYLKNILLSIKQLSENINFKKFNVNSKFNLLLATHSPFILSDIPSQNVLKLKDGKPVAGDSINSFGANIHDLLADEFFLDKGFMGEFAKEKINSLIKFLQVKILRNRETHSSDEKEKKKLNEEIIGIGEIVEYKKDTCKQIISQIGEPMLSISLENLYKEAFSTNTKIEDIEEEINRLLERKKELLNKN